MFFEKEAKKSEEVGGIPPADGGCFLHVLHGGSKQALLGNLRKPPHTAITEAMYFFGIGKAALHRFLPSLVNILNLFRMGEGIRHVLIIFPYMTAYALSFLLFTQAFLANDKGVRNFRPEPLCQWSEAERRMLCFFPVFGI